MNFEAEELDTSSMDTVLIMVHKRIRKRESYDIDSDEIITALSEQGYPMEREEVLDLMGKLKEVRYIRAYEDIEDVDPATGRRIQPHVIRYSGIEITPEGALRAQKVMDSYRNP
jgi:hypothetical protein